jgi:hypothetical protein
MLSSERIDLRPDLVFIIFSRRLNREWYLFLDDLTVATARLACLPPGPSGADDVIAMSIRAHEVPGRIPKNPMRHRSRRSWPLQLEICQS